MITLGYIDKSIRKPEFVANTQFLYQSSEEHCNYLVAFFAVLQCTFFQSYIVDLLKVK